MHPHSKLAGGKHLETAGEKHLEAASAQNPAEAVAYPNGSEYSYIFNLFLLGIQRHGHADRKLAGLEALTGLRAVLDPCVALRLRVAGPQRLDACFGGLKGDLGQV